MRLKLMGNRKVARCCFCRMNITLQSATLEHIIPRSLGGDWSDSNLTLACFECNHDRGNAEFNGYRDWRRGIVKIRPSGAALLHS